MYEFRAGKFLRTEDLSPRQRRDVDLGITLMSLLWRAGIETGAFDLDEVRSRGCCLLASSALVDVFHALGRREAHLHRAGINLTTWRAGEMVSSTTVGHPAAPPVDHLWNAHMIVGVRGLLLDPTFVQMLSSTNPLLHFAVFMRTQGRGCTFDLCDFGKVGAVASSAWRIGDCRYEARLFRLPREVDVATRQWRSRPDAHPERRAELVKRTLELIEIDARSRALGSPPTRSRNSPITENALPGAH